MRRLAALLLILCLVFCLLPTMSAASGISVCFIAANDNLLELSYQPYWQGSTNYVPYTVFVNFKIYNSFHQSSNTASLYSSTKQLYFNLDSGETYDGNGTYYNVTPISRGGQVYVPLDFICGQSGLNWSYINSSTSFIHVRRLSDANVILPTHPLPPPASPRPAGIPERLSTSRFGRSLTPRSANPTRASARSMFSAMRTAGSSRLYTRLSTPEALPGTGIALR